MVSIELKIDFSSFNVEELVRQRAKALMVEPDLVSQKELAHTEYYKRFQDITDKDKFRALLLDGLFEKWKEIFGFEEAPKIKHSFIELIKAIEHDGALVFADLVSKREFESFIIAYNNLDFGGKHNDSRDEKISLNF